MENILDSEAILKKSNKYSKLSFFIGLTALLGFCYLFSLIPTTIRVKDEIPTPPLFLIKAIQVSVFSGFVFTILSFKTKENGSIYKWVGGILNILLAVFILFSTILKFISQYDF